ncbi:hypothetical protein FH972_004520 [Carpinus fangiana]|uniref:Uncharacterized protein n=1 Tax=Carpinus fangiana TaxID=176857 RepID=A0A5N6QM16_9ROSI|nr:hypothetical protein FH972_004520 [Carpinus fangiana]
MIQRSPRRLTSEQELSIMVAALTNVVSGCTSSTTASTSEYCADPTPIPPSELDTCQLNFPFPDYAAAETSNSQPSTTSSGQQATDQTGRKHDFCEGIGEDEIQQWMMMMDFAGDSSDSTATGTEYARSSTSL